MQHSEIIAAIRIEHRERCFAMEQRKRLHLALLAYLRLVLGWRKDLPEKERKAIAKRAEAIADGKDDPETERWRMAVAASMAARIPFDKIEKDTTLSMEKLSKQLSAWDSFGQDVRGFGARSLGVIAAEAGDLSEYATHSKLWKRMGLAVIDGKRQGGLSKSAAKEDWIVHGYNRQRRSRMWNIGDAMIKAQVRKVKDDDAEDTGERTAIGRYGELYLKRKAYELARDPEMIPMHAHRRAQRYMEKRLLKDLWRAWRRADGHVTDERRSIAELPAANEHRSAV